MTQITHLYTDGGCLGASRSPVGGSWAWVGVDDEDQVVISRVGVLVAGEYGMDSVTANVTEFYAMLSALEAMPDGWVGTVHADSFITIGRFSKGWAVKGVPPELVKRAAYTRSLKGRVTYRHLDGHPTAEQLRDGVGKRGNPVSRFNVLADRLCGQALVTLKQMTSVLA